MRRGVLVVLGFALFFVGVGHTSSRRSCEAPFDWGDARGVAMMPIKSAPSRATMSASIPVVLFQADDGTVRLVTDGVRRIRRRGGPSDNDCRVLLTMTRN